MRQAVDGTCFAECSSDNTIASDAGIVLVEERPQRGVVAATGGLMQTTTNGSSKKNSSKRVEDVENKSLAQGNQVDDGAELGADNDGDIEPGADAIAEQSIETATLRDKEGRLVESDDTKRASGNRSNSQFRQSDQHGNMTRPDDRRRGQGFVRH